MPLPPANLLGTEASPYLRQHEQNPVHWRGWSAAALAEAVELDRPILLSIGYAACHWCHVMAHECFEDAEVADAMNNAYVNIKVDREERPDIDQIYMAALHATGEQGGWPLTMFLTPQAKPIWGGTYFPKHSTHGRPGFLQVLEAVGRAWRERREELNTSSQALSLHVESQLAASEGEVRDTPSGALVDLAARIGQTIDMEIGGLRGAPKFPNAPFLQTLWLSWLETRTQQHRDAVLTSLREMLKGGIYDHVGGGLCRYSTDARWNVPHFEKMLYDNAQLVRLLLWAHGETREPFFEECVEATITWLFREMRTPEGAFASSLDADSAGLEGLYYTWNQSEIDSILGPAAELFWTHFQLVSPSHWHGDPILRRKTQSGDEAAVNPLLERLRHRRGDREKPGRDDKALIDWNGMTIRALAEAGLYFGRSDWVAEATTAYRSVAESVDASDRLPHSILGDARVYPAMSSDYAAMASAAVALCTATGQAPFAADAVKFLDHLDRWYGDEAGTGHYLTASDSRDVPIRVRGDFDDAVPSPTAQIIEALASTATLTGNPGLLERAATVARAARGRISEQPYGQAGIVNATALTSGMRKLVIVGPGGQDREMLAEVARRTPDPRRIDRSLRAESGLVELLEGVFADGARPGAWLCLGQTCLPPIHDRHELELALRKGASAGQANS